MKRILVRRIRRPSTGKTPAIRKGGKKIVANTTLLDFNPAMLNLGDIKTPSQEIEAIAAVFDLSGFTKFCNQVDAYLEIPRFLGDFLEWFFNSIRKKLTEKDSGKRSYVWADLPVLVKFLGDGLLLVWNARTMTESQACRIAAALYDICHMYQSEFYPEIRMAVNKPPRVLRCGISRGKVFSVGSGRDYVGHCINNASRLCQLPLTFCFPHRGFQVLEHMPDEYSRLFVLKYISIRGVGDNELVWVGRDEFERLPDNLKSIFRNIDRNPAMIPGAVSIRA